MGTLAVLFAVLAVAVPLQESASAQTPEPSISLTVSDVKFETATVDITVTNVNSTNIPALNWRVNVVFKTDAYEHPHKNAGPTHPVSPGQESYSFLYNVSNTGTVTADVDLNWLIPASEYTVEVKLCDTDCGSRNVKAEASTTFSTKSGCTAQPEPNRGKWFPGYHFTKVTENELIVRVHVNSSYAPLNSGRCVYYTYNTYFEHDYSEIRTAYIRHIGSGGRTAQIELTDLDPGTRYGYHITLDKEAEDNAAGFSGSTLGPNTGISDIVFTNITNDSAKATATVKNASTDDKFVYWRYRESPLDGDPGIWLTLDKVSTKTSTADKDFNYLDAGTRYEVEASVKDNFNLGMSMTRAFVTLPGKPGISPLEAGDGSLKVTWTAPTEGAATITGYRVQWQETEERFTSEFPPPTLTLDDADVDEDDTSYTITGLTNGINYIVHVIAKNESGGTSSDDAFGTPMSIPNAPNNLQVAEGNEKLTLTWEEPTAKEGVTITDYVVEYKENAAQNWTSSNAAIQTISDTQTYLTIIPDLTNDTLYDVQVRADNGVTSDNYEWATGSGTPVPGPSIRTVTVDLNSVTQTEATATVTIDRANDSTQTILLQHRTLPSGGWSTPAITDTSATGSKNIRITGLTGNTEYEVQAWLQTNVATKVKSLPFTTSPVVPEAPDITSVAHGDRELTVTWTAPSETGGADIEYFVVQWKPNTVDWTSPLVQDDSTIDETVLTSTITGLSNGTTYDIRVRADNGVVPEAGQDYNWDEHFGTPDALPGKPIIQSVVEGNTQLVVTWDEPANTGSDITGYVVQWKNNSVSGWESPLGSSTLEETDFTHTITSLANGTEYAVRVRAVNGLVFPDEEDDDYNWSDDATGTPRPEPIVTGVTVADSTITRTSATATVAIENQTGDSQTVHLRHRVNTSGSSWTDATPKDTAGSSETFNLSSLEGNTEYVVEAWLAGTSSVKGSVTFTTKPVEPDAPRNVRITGHGGRELTVAWDAPSDTGGSQITDYKVQWKLSSQNDWNTYTERVDDDGQSPYKITEHLTNGDEYAVRIIAVTSAGDGSPSNEAKDTPRTIPDAPTISSVTEGDRKLTVIWSAPSEDGGADVTGYKVQWKDNSVTTDWDSPTGVTEVSASGLTREITSLTNDTTYGVRVRADNGETSDAYNWDVGEGTPRPDPSIDSISVADSTITQTTAVATVNIADPTGDALMVHLRYRVNSSSEAWTTPTPQSTTISSVAFPQFTGLKSDTEYKVEASFDSTFNSGVQFKLFTTKRPTVLSVVVDDSTISQAGATATVTIEEPNGKQQTVRLRYRPSTQDDWSTTATDAGEIPVNTSTDVAAVPISDLKSGTLYEVEASLESDYSQSATTTFTTESPSLTGLTFSEVMQESAKATIGIQAPNGRSLPVFVRYRKVTDPVNGLWEYVDTSSTGATADAPLSNLSSGTEYEVQASLVSTFLVDTISETFTTHDPSLSALTVMSITLTGATLKVDIQAPNGESQTINYRYRPVTQTDWTTTATDAGSDSTTSTTGSAEFTLASLTSGTQYQIQVSLDTDLNNPTLPVLEATLTTLTPDPSISDVAIDAKQTTAKATITIANPGTSGNTVHLHFREQGTNAWSSPALTSTTAMSEAIIDMTGLAERTTYEVEVALNSGFTSSTTVTFTTLVTPTITSVSVDDITKTTATATVAIANPDGTDRTVHLQYRIKDATPADTWTKAMEDSDTGSQEFDLSSLRPGTTYEVEASFDSNFGTGVEDTEFTTTYAPSVSSVSVGDITKTTATAVVSIANPDDTSRTVHLQYREKDATPADTWTKAMEDTDTGSQEFDLTSLTPGTTYEVQASFDSSFSPHKDTTFTTVFEPSISAVGVGDIEKTTATATVVIANPDGTNKTVNLQYREYNQEPEAEWTKPTPKDTSAGSETFDLSSLIPGTTYEVQASFDTNFDTYKDTTFTTKFAPTISAVRVDPDSITKTTASVIVIIANPDGTDQTVQLQYRIRDPQGNWSSTQTEDTTTGTATINLTGLTAGTTYEVEVSLASGFGSTQTATFTTKYEPSISSVSMGSVTQTTATAAISIDNADDSIQTVHLQYREKDATPPAGWTSATPETSTTSAASIDISGLTADKTYEVEAWLANDTAKKVTATFTTLEAPNGNPTPSVSSVSMGSITMTTATATVNIANPDTAANTVNLRHSVKDANIWTPHTKSEMGSTVSFPLASLIAGTAYEVEAWLGSDTANKVTASFTTSPAPSISSISVGSITRTSATATVNIANPGTAQNTVNLRYSVKDKDSWTDHPKTETGSTVAFLLSSLTAGTTYEVEAWLGSDTGNKATTTFTTTLPAAVLSPTINSVRVGNILETTATATVNIDNADGSTQTAKLQYRTTNSQGNWSSTYENTSTTGTATINFSGMTAGTRYQVQAWLASDLSDKVTASFQTQQAAPNNPPPPQQNNPPPQRSPVNPTPPVTKSPEVASVSVTNETQTTVDATVKIDNAGTAQNTVNLRYSVDGENSWTDHTKTETGSTVAFPLSSLTAGTTYEVEAWLGSDTDNKVTATFTTSMAPSISSISVGGITKTSATATVNIANPGDAQNTVNLRYSVDGENSWTDHMKTETGSTVAFPLSSLTAGTTYEVEAWLGSDTDNKVTATFTTSMAPSISSISVGGITKTSATATVNIANPGDAQNTVNLRYSVDGENSWTDQTKTETGSAVEFPLSNLTAGTVYKVEAWLGSDTDNKMTATFMTIQAAAVTPPSISSVRVLNIAQTNARVVVGLANANTGQKVYMQYKLSSAQWPTTLPQPTTQMNGSATFILSNLKAGTGYHTRVSLNSGMSDATIRSFTTTSPITPRNPTPPRSPVVPPPSVSSVTFDNETQTSADATVNIANPGTAKKTVRLQYRVDGTTAWSTPPKSENTSGSSATFAMTNLTAATTYEIQAWLNTNSPPSGTQIYTFTTLANDPGISNLKMENIRQTSATAMVEIADAGTEMKEVYLKHSTDGADEWTQIPFPTITYSDSTSINLTGLKEQTTYQVMVDLTDGFDKPKSSTFTTLAAPSLSGVSISSITQTGAVATVQLSRTPERRRRQCFSATASSARPSGTLPRRRLLQARARHST